MEMRQFAPVRSGQKLQGTEVAVMFHLGEQNPLAGF